MVAPPCCLILLARSKLQLLPILMWRRSDRVTLGGGDGAAYLKVLPITEGLTAAYGLNQPFRTFPCLTLSFSKCHKFQSCLGHCDLGFLHSQVRIQLPRSCQDLYPLSICLLAFKLLLMLLLSLYIYAFLQKLSLSCWCLEKE